MINLLTNVVDTPQPRHLGRTLIHCETACSSRSQAINEPRGNNEEHFGRRNLLSKALPIRIRKRIKAAPLSAAFDVEKSTFRRTFPLVG